MQDENSAHMSGQVAAPIPTCWYIEIHNHRCPWIPGSHSSCTYNWGTLQTESLKVFP